jgi:hypothetical protein
MEGRGMEIPDIDQLLNDDQESVNYMRQFLANVSADLPRLLNEASVLYTTCGRAFGQGGGEYVHAILDKNGEKERMALLIRELLFSRIGGLYMMAVTDLLRMRVTAPYAYARLQCESLAFMKLMKLNPNVAEEFMAAKTEEEGLRFYQKNQKDVKKVLQQYNLLFAYDITSEAGVHCRLIGLAPGFSSTEMEEGYRRIHTVGISTQEFNAKYPQYFLSVVLFVLQVQARIFENVLDAAPEINDRLLIETRIPRFLEEVTSTQGYLRKTVFQLPTES